MNKSKKRRQAKSQTKEPQQQLAQARVDLLCPICDPKPMFHVTIDQVERLANGKGYVWKGQYRGRSPWLPRPPDVIESLPS